MSSADQLSGPPPPDTRPPQPAAHLVDTGWTDEFNLSGLEGWVYAAVEYRGELVVAGTFTAAGTPTIRNIARWDGQRWQPLGNGVSVAYRLVVFNGDLIAAGPNDSLDNGEVLNGLALWDGAAWHSIAGAPASTSIESFLVHDRKLYMAGRFKRSGDEATYSVIAWDGHDWSWLAPPFDGYVTALAVFNDQVVAAGAENLGTGRYRVRAVRWTGTAAGWLPLPNPFTEDIYYPSVWAASYKGRLILSAGERLAGWNGDTWISIAHPFQKPCCYLSAPAFRLKAIGNDLILFGDFANDDRTISDIARWDGATWSSIGTPPDGSCRERVPNDLRPGNIVEAIGECDGNLVAAGCFGSIGGEQSNNVARWDGRAWHPFGGGSGLRSLLYYYLKSGVVMLEDGSVLAYPVYTTSNGIGIARWDGEKWTTLGAEAERSRVNRAAVYKGRLFADIVEYGKAGLAEWTGTQWTVVPGMGFTGAVEVIGDYLYAAVYGGEMPAGVYRYNGTEWTFLAGTFNGTIRSLAGSGPFVFAGGNFSAVDNTLLRNIAHWNGVRWEPVGTGMDGEVTAMTIFRSELVAGGRFTEAGGAAARNIARWDGSSWHPLADGLPDWPNQPLPPVQDLIEFKGTLLAGGEFHQSGGWDGTFHGIAGWDGSAWYWLGAISNVHQAVDGLAASSNDLYAVGRFIGMADRPAYGIAHWSSTTNQRGINYQSLLLFVSSNPFHADVSFYFVLTTQDHVQMSVFNIAGQRVASIDAGIQSAGSHTLVWNGNDLTGNPTPSGIYFARLETAGSAAATTKLVKVR